MKRRQHGAALLTAMIIVSVVTTLAAGMVWQQWRAVQVEAAERARAQSAWILAGALDWARLILREDGRASKIDHLGEPWAVPLEEARLSTFLAADAENTEDAPDAFLSGRIVDAQSRFNLTNLTVGRTVVKDQLVALQRLCELVGVSSDVAARIAEGMRAAAPPEPPPPGASAPAEQVTDPPLLPRSVNQLAWFGVPPEALRALEPFMTILPAKVLVNPNTASKEVLVASIPDLDLATAERIVQSRQRAPLLSKEDLRRLAPSLPPGAEDRLTMVSNFFEVHGRLRLDAVVLEQRSLVERSGPQVVVRQRERVSSRDGALLQAAEK